MSEDLAVVSAEDSQGRILSGAGASLEALQETMARHAPAAESDAPDRTPPNSGTGADAAGTPQPVKPTRGARRIDQVVGEREAAKREAAAATAKATALEARLAALEAAPKPTAAAVITTPALETPKVAPAKFTFPDFDTYVREHPEKSWDDWTDAKVDALTDWKLQQRQPVSQTDIDARIRASIEADRASRSRDASRDAIVARGIAAYPDFDAVRQSAADVPFSNDTIEWLLNQPNAEHLIYAIAKDRAFAEQLSKASPVDFAWSLAQRVPSMGVATPASTSAAGSVTVPAPYQPVGSGSATTVLPSADLAKHGFDFDRSGYREKRAAERGVRRAR